MKITEVTAAQYLDHLRSEIDGYLDLSFPTISGYKENAAMMHYEAVEGSCKELSPEGMLAGGFRRTIYGRNHRCDKNHRAWPCFR